MNPDFDQRRHEIFQAVKRAREALDHIDRHIEQGTETISTHDLRTWMHTVDAALGTMIPPHFQTGENHS